MVLSGTTRMETRQLKKSNTHWFCYNSCYYKGMKTGDENDELEKKRTRELMTKYMANYGAHKKGMSREEITNYYTQWSENKKYEQDLDPSHYFGPKIAAESVAELYTDKRDKIKILDIACGTGFVGEQLYELDFRNIDGLDPSAGMLNQCKRKNIYHNLYEEYCCDTPTQIEDSIYDCAVVSGGFGEGHIPCSGLNEMVRVVKTGGYIVIVMRKEYLKYVTEYMDRLEPYMDKLEQDGKWETFDRKEADCYSFERQGVVYTFRVTKGLPQPEKQQKTEKADGPAVITNGTNTTQAKV